MLIHTKPLLQPRGVTLIGGDTSASPRHRAVSLGDDRRLTIPMRPCPTAASAQRPVTLLAMQHRALRRFALAATIAVFLAVVMGSVVCATDSSAACPNWPGCYSDGLLPRAELNPIIEAFHRLVAMVSTPLVLVVAVWASRRPGLPRWQRVLPWAALAGCLLAGLFGMMLILFTLPLPLAVLDVASSLVALGAMTVFTTALGRPWAWSRAATLAACGLCSLLALHLTALVAAGPGSYTRCLGWPTLGCVDADPSLAWAVTRWALAAATIALMTASAIVARDRRAWLPLALAAAALTTSTAVLHAGMEGPLPSLNSALAVGVVAALAWWFARCIHPRSGKRQPI